MFAKMIAALAALLTLTSVPALATNDKPDTPTSVERASVISVDDAKDLLDKKAAAFFDMRNPLNFGKSHLPGASLIAYKERSDYKPDFDGELDTFDLTRLPTDKEATIVLYSDGPKGWKSYKAAFLAGKAGYTKVFWMREGFAVWTSKGLPTER